jgi:hypothetical protein
LDISWENSLRECGILEERADNRLTALQDSETIHIQADEK